MPAQGYASASGLDTLKIDLHPARANRLKRPASLCSRISSRTKGEEAC
jgi:hypothetical protein